METELWVTITEVASHFQVHEMTIRRWIKDREMPSQKIGKAWRFKLSEADAWARAGGANDVEGRN